MDEYFFFVVVASVALGWHNLYLFRAIVCLLGAHVFYFLVYFCFLHLLRVFFQDVRYGAVSCTRQIFLDMQGLRDNVCYFQRGILRHVLSISVCLGRDDLQFVHSVLRRIFWNSIFGGGPGGRIHFDTWDTAYSYGLMPRSMFVKRRFV